MFKVCSMMFPFKTSFLKAVYFMDSLVPHSLDQPLKISRQ